MSFFGFDSSGHNTAAPGFSQAQDPFAGLANRNDNDDALDFEDTYDGLGDHLDETGDAFNDDTFGPSGLGGVGKDFDFFGQTAKVADAIEEEHLRFNRQQPVTQTAPKVPAALPMMTPRFYGATSATAKPARTGYEKYKEPEPELQVDAALWGVAPKKPAAAVPAPPPPWSRRQFPKAAARS